MKQVPYKAESLDDIKVGQVIAWVYRPDGSGLTALSGQVTVKSDRGFHVLRCDRNDDDAHNTSYFGTDLTGALDSVVVLREPVNMGPREIFFIREKSTREWFNDSNNVHRWSPDIQLAQPYMLDDPSLLPANSEWVKFAEVPF